MAKNIQLFNKQNTQLNPYTDNFKNVLQQIPSTQVQLQKRVGSTILYVGQEQGFRKGGLYKCVKEEGSTYTQYSWQQIEEGTSAYSRQFVTSSPYTVTDNALWLILTVSGSQIILPAGNTNMYIRVSTDYKTQNVTITPAAGQTIDGDAQGLILDKTSGTVQLMWSGTEWTVIEAK